MASLGTNYLILFGLSSLLAFVFPFFKDGVLKKLSVQPLVKSILPFLLVILPIGALYAVAGALNIEVNVALPCFGVAAILSFILSRVGMPPQLRGVLLLVSSLLLTMNLHVNDSGSNTGVILASTMLGLIVAKLTDQLLLGGEQTLDDIISPLIWLTTVAWLNGQDDKALVQQREGLVLGIISVAQILRIMQRPFTKDDKILIKRLMLSATGGLGVLLVINKLVLNQHMAPIALLAGGSLLATYLFQNMDLEGQNKVKGTTAVKMLIVIGMLTMVATRFYGMFGLLCMAPAAIVAPWGGMAQFAGLFFCTRVLLQVFIGQYNENVTGINLEHAYVGAAQYAGFITIACLLMLLREIRDRRAITAIFLVAGAIVPMAANYYLHAEPTSSMLVATAAAAIILATLGPCMMQQEEPLGVENVLLMPAMMAVVGVTFGGLIEAGNNATNLLRTQILEYVLGAAVICLLASWITKRIIANKKTALTASSD